MIAKIKYQECFDKYERFPRADNEKEEFFFPTVVANYILLISSKSAKGHAKNLSNELTRLITRLNIEQLIFVGDYKRAWRYQDNSYMPVQEALNYLERNKVSKAFDGALDVPASELSTFFSHLFWLVRCNAALRYFILWT